jgi:hypothetical protein
MHRPTFRTSLFAAALFACTACSKDDEGTSTEDGTDTDAATTAPTSGDPSGGPSGGPTGDPSGGPSGDPSGGPTGDPSGGPTGDPSGDPSGDPTGEACVGDWSLGSVPFSGEPTLGQACDDPNVPKNCADGTFIIFNDTSECICIALCSSLGVGPGDNCTQDGTWVCEKILATNAGMNSATACVNKNWNVCTDGGGGGTSDSATSASDSSSASDSASSDSASSSDTSTECSESGARCSFDDDCCSGTCDFGVCL